MREILFKGKMENGLWRIGYLSFEDKITIKIKCYDYKGDYVATSIEEYKIDKNTVGQYTGLTDKNGKKIFEGDIVKGLFLHGSAILGVVAFQDGAFGLAWKRGKIDEFSPFPCICNVDYRIVGNIYDNTELLEKTNEN